MADVFISYKREDRGTAQRLADALGQLGFDVWWDLDLLAGDKYRNVIRAVIDQCSAAVVLWSTKSIESDFVMDEASHAKRKGKLCPAVIDNVELPFGFGQTHADDLTGWDGELTHAGFQALVRSLETRIGRKARLGIARRSEEAEALNAELGEFQAAQLASNVSAFRTFLARHPRGAFATFVRGQIETIEANAPTLLHDEPQAPQPPPEPRPRAQPPDAPPPTPIPQPPPGRRPSWLWIALAGVVVTALVFYAFHRQAQDEERARDELAAQQASLEQERKAREAAEARAKEMEAKADQDRELREQVERKRLATQEAETQRLAREKAPPEAAARAAEAARAVQQPAVKADQTAFDVAQLHPDVSAAAIRARDVERRANAAAAKAREVAAKAKTGGVANPQDGLGTAAETGNRAGDGYAGSFRNGRWNGLGVRSLGENPDNTVGALRQEGEFVDGALSFGVGYWRTGARYAGGYRNGKRNGPGVFTYPDGKRFEGELVDGHFAGYGVMWNPQGTAAEAGVWADDKMTTPLAPPRR